MAHFSDLAPCSYFSLPQEGKLIAVGWLEPGEAYVSGNVDLPFFRRLCELLSDPWQPAVTLGRHACGFCRFTGGPKPVRFENTNLDVGAANLFVPAEGVVYVAPSLIVHYIDAHGYAPPEPFQSAVMDCPRMRSIEYLKAVLANGPKGLNSIARTDGANFPTA